ncbi:MAG TPA: ATP-binding protein [Oligoflexia bacterium]|nr:ATP-binding protein [Oligoflexia bacterium]
MQHSCSLLERPGVKELPGVREVFGDDRALLEAVLDATDAKIAYLDLAFNFVWINFAFEEATNRQPEDIIGKNYPVVCHDNDSEEVLRYVRDSGVSVSCKDRPLALSGQSGGGLTYWDWSLVPVKDAAGQVVGLVLSLRETTGRKRADEERKKLELSVHRAHKLESLGLLAGGIAHDFNNLLAGLFGYISLARSYAQSGMVHKVGPALDNALSAFERAKALTQQLITFSRGGDPQRKTLAIEPLLRNIAGLALSGSNISVEWDVGEDLELCDVDENQLSQALGNILINAKDVMPGGGRVFISAKNVVIQQSSSVELAAGRYVLISVRDSGPGILQAHLEHVFDPFFSTKQAGRGLGLSIAYSIAKKHGGAIFVESDGGNGAVFSLYLPVSSGAAAVKAAGEVDVEKRKWSVLVMDDEEMIREVISAMLLALGCRVVCARNGQEAVKIYQTALRERERFDAVILDLTVRNGLGAEETLRALSQIDPSVCAIVSSGYSNSPLMLAPLDFGFKARIMKPYQASDLAVVLNSALNKSPGINERASAV